MWHAQWTASISNKQLAFWVGTTREAWAGLTQESTAEWSYLSEVEPWGGMCRKQGVETELGKLSDPQKGCQSYSCLGLLKIASCVEAVESLFWTLSCNSFSQSLTSLVIGRVPSAFTSNLNFHWTRAGAKMGANLSPLLSSILYFSQILMNKIFLLQLKREALKIGSNENDIFIY